MLHRVELAKIADLDYTFCHFLETSAMPTIIKTLIAKFNSDTHKKSVASSQKAKTVSVTQTIHFKGEVIVSPRDEFFKFFLSAQ